MANPLRSLKRAFLKAWNALIRRVTGRSEMSRILNRHEGYSSDLVQAIARSIARSSEKDTVFGKKLFDVTVISTRLVDKKAISDEDKPRLIWCLEVSDGMVFEVDVGMVPCVDRNTPNCAPFCRSLALSWCTEILL